MEKSEAAAYLAGAKQVEGAEASAPTNLHVISGEVVEKSENGKVKVDLGGLVFNGDDEQSVEIATIGGLEVGDTATILLSGQEHRGMTPLGVGGVGTVDRIVERVSSIEADYIKTAVLEAEQARIDTLEATSLTADSAVIQELQVGKEFVDDLAANNITVNRLVANSAYINNLELQGITTDKISATTGYIDDLTSKSITTDKIQAASGYIDSLTAANITASDISADHATVGQLDATYATIGSLNAEQARVNNLLAGKASVADLTAANGRIDNLQSTKADISVLESDYITADAIDATYLHADMSNADVAWIQNGVIKDGSISNAMINSLSANKLTAGTINGETINVTNINANNITAGTINGQRIGEGSLSLDKLSEDVYTEQEVDNKLATMQAEIDGAIETWTGTAVPTLNNSPASNWTTAAIKDTHVGDVYFVVNSQSEQNGYNYRFTKSGNTYSWQLIKDSDVTNALSRLSTAEGKITTFDSDISTLKTDTGTLKTKTTNLETRMSDAEDDILDKVDTTTFNEVSDTVDQHSQTITQMSQTLSNKADGSTVTSLTQRVSKNEQDISGINTTIGELSTTVESKADGSTVESVSNRLNTVSNTVDGHTQSITNITSTQTTMQGKLDKTIVESTQLWYTKANTTAPSKPTSQVTSTSTSGGAWRTVVPAYSASYPNYFYCYQWKYSDGTYGWSSVTRDIAMGESQSTSRTAASDASTAKTDAATAVSTANTASTNASDALAKANTADTNASTALSTANTAAGDASTAKSDAAAAVSTANTASSNASTAVSTANTAKATADKNVKSTVQLWFTKADETAPSKPTSKVTSTAVSGNGWRTVVPTYSSSYPYYFYCYQYELADGTYIWSDVVYDRATTENQSNSRSAVSGVSTLTTKTNNISNTVEGHTSQLNSITETQTSIQGSAVKSTVQLWFTKANTTAPAKPTAHVTTDNASTANAWNLAVPTYNSSYPYYYYCYEHQLLNDTYTWSAVTRDIATEENQSTSRSAKATADKNLKESQQLWFTKANSTAPSKPTSKVTSTATTGNAWTTRVPIYNDSYKYYFYCMQYVAADGTVTWSDVIYDQATTEAQSVARTASANLSTLQTDYATFKQTTTQFESTVGETYATKTELQTTDGNVSSLTTRVSTAETNIQQNASDIALRATKTEASQMAQPNLAPIGSMPMSDVYNASTNPSGYWKATTTSWFTNLDDGWVRCYRDNTDGTSAINAIGWRPSPSPSVEAGKVYTILTEIRNNNSSGSSQTDMYLQQIANNQFWGDINGATIDDDHVTTTTNISLRTCGETYVRYSYRIADTEHLTTDPVALFRYNFRLPAGGKFDFEFRQSVYEGIYDGPYKPYAGSQLYASQAELKVASDAIDLKVSKNDVINQINVSTEDITIDADRVNITGAAIFTTGRLSESTLNSTYDANGAAATVQNNLNNLQIGGRNLCAESQWEVGYLQTGTTAALHAEDAHKERTSALISVAPGDLLTFQAWVLDTTGWETWQPWLGYRFYSDASTPIGSREAKYNTTGTNYVSWAGITVPEGAAFVRFSWRHYGGSRSKLELGNKATDWSPAPEDVTADALASGIEYIEGTQTATTNLWTGVTKETALVAGKSIAYKLTHAGTSTAATLNLTLAGGGTTGAKAVKMVYSTSSNTGALSNVTTHWPVNSIIQMTYDGTQWVISNYNTNVDDKNARNIRFYNTIVAGEALKAASIIGMHADGKFYQVKEHAYFLLSAPLLWLTTDKAAEATNADAIYTHAYDVNLGTYYTSFVNTTNNCTVYLVGTVSGNTFSTYGSSSAQYLTVTEPTTEDGRFYIPLGRLGNASTGENYFNYVVDYPVSLYAYLDGKFRQVTPTEVVATQTIYIQAASGTGSVSGTTTWVESAAESASSDDSSVTPIWTTKRPTYRTQFPVTFVATQHKRLDGTVTCTTPCKDDTTTVIDGGHITTGTIDASVASITNINASNITSGQISADYINTTGLLISTSQVDGLASKMEGYDDTLKNMADEAALRGKWVKVDEDGVEVGNGGNATRVTADSVDFLVGGNQVATAGVDGFAATHMSTPAIDIGEDWSITVSGGMFSINYIGS